MSIKVGVIADDLTGSGDVGLYFAGKGLNTVIINGKNKPHHKKALKKADLLVINTESRHIKPVYAYRRVKKAIKNILDIFGNQKIVLYKKIDSTLRGNIGSEIDALIDELNRRGKKVFSNRIPFIPAFPKMGRTTVKGRHYVNGVRIDKSFFAEDPRAPVKNADLRAFLKETSKNSDSVNIIDCSKQHTLIRQAERINRLLNSKYDIVAVVASAGLSEEISKLVVSRDKYKKSNNLCKKPGILVISGSKNPVSYGQIRNLRSYLRNNPQFRGNPVIIFDTFKIKGSPSSVMKYLLKRVEKLVKSSNIHKIVAVGGETAYGVSKYLKSDVLKVIGSIEAGMAVCEAGGKILVIKPGGFGGPNALVRAVAKLSKLNS